jgi:hypothetical protein
MTVYTGATTGNIVASYDTPDDGDGITAASVNVALHGLTDDVARIAFGDNVVLSGNKELQGLLVFDAYIDHGVSARVTSTTATLSIGTVDPDMDELRFVSLTGGPGHAMTLAHPTSGMVGRRLRIVIESTGSADDGLTVSSPAGTIAVIPPIESSGKIRWLDLVVAFKTGPNRWRWVVSACDTYTSDDLGAEAFGAS